MTRKHTIKRSLSCSDIPFEEEKRPPSSPRHPTYPGSPGRSRHPRHFSGIPEPIKVLLWLVSEMIKRVDFIAPIELKPKLRLIEKALDKARGENKETAHVLFELRKFYGHLKTVPDLYDRHDEIFMQTGMPILALSELYCRDLSVIKLPDDIPYEIGKLIKEILFVAVFPVRKVEELSDYMECRYAPLSSIYLECAVEPPFPMDDIRKIICDRKMINEIASYFPKEERNASYKLINFLDYIGATIDQYDLKEHVKLIRLITLFKYVQRSEFAKDYSQ